MYKIHLLMILFSLSQITFASSDRPEIAQRLRGLTEDLVLWIKYEINDSEVVDDRLKREDTMQIYYVSHFDQLMSGNFLCHIFCI